MVSKVKKISLVNILFPVALVLEAAMFLYDGNEYHWNKIGIILAISIIVSIYIYTELNNYVKTQTEKMLKENNYNMYENISINVGNGYMSIRNIDGYVFLMNVTDVNSLSCNHGEYASEITILMDSDKYPTVSFVSTKEEVKSVLGDFEALNINIVV